MAAQSAIVPLITLLLFTSSLFPSFLARSLPPFSHTTTSFNISASLQQAHQLLHSRPQTLKPFSQQQEQIIPTNSSCFSLQLHPRESLLNSHFKDYKSLVLSRLGRDSARVNSLNLKVQLALDKFNYSDFKPVETEIRPEDFSSPLESGKSQGSGEYFARIGVGSPAKLFYMVPDTGSDISWLQCQPCSDCYQQSDPTFDPKSSSSYSPLSCTSQQCRALRVSGCRNGGCLYQVTYGDGSFTVGDFATETLTFGNSGSVNNIALGCGHDNEGLFIGSAGLLGLGGGMLSLASQLKASSFSYCLVDRDSSSSSTLEFNSVKPSDSVTAPILKSSRVKTFFYVGLTGISVGGQLLNIPPSLFRLDESGSGGIIVDSGTAITRLQTEAYNTLRDAFVKLTKNLPKANGVSLFDTCYDLSSQASVRVPTVSFHFSGDKTLALPAKNYLVLVDSPGTYCFAFAPSSSALSIIGNFQQQGTRVSYDLANSEVGFSVDKC